MENNDILCTPDNVRRIAADATKSLLPAKSRQRYEDALDAFECWKHTQNVPAELYTETVILAYFSGLSERYAGSTLWSIYSMLHKTIGVSKGVDISTFAKLQALLKQKMVGHRAKKSDVFSRENIERFMRDADDNNNLHVKVVALFSLYGACRKSEIVGLNVDDVSDAGVHLVVRIRDSKTGPRSFLIVGCQDPELDALVYFRRYFALRPQGAPARLFLGLRNGKCTKQPIGRNTLATYPRKIAEFLGLDDPKGYTSHAFRRSSATWVADSGVDIVNLKRFGGWKSDSVAQGYVADSIGNKRELAIALQGAVDKQQVHVSAGGSTGLGMPLNITNCQDCVFNINICPKQ